MWVFLSRRLRMWLLLAIALPLARAVVHRLAVAAEHRNPSTRTARTLGHADSVVDGVSRRAARSGKRGKRRRGVSGRRQG
jgi:hypothetical protein